jgi:tRNA (cmo5U34)-methyltransferase
MTTTDHRVLAHLGLTADDYDAAIRTYIPAYETMIATVVRLVGDGPQLVIDLGTGTGALAASILDATTQTRVRLVDIDPAMLEVAGARVARHLTAGRAELVTARFADASALVPCDAVIASLALHHVTTTADKLDLYRRIHAALRPGGLLAIADATVHPDGPEHATIYAQWAAEMATHGITRTRAAELFAAWAQEDRYLPLATELSLLADAGFTRPDCFWKYGPMTVYGGYR